ncbi:MAG: WYL domain-containing protein [Lachnospiraceae bacterium]|nr:WYL domain-containing protein [Lachnospiraceae bacterium]
MPKGTNQKLKLYYLIQMLEEKTDDKHGITMPEILKELERHEITAERKSIYNDMETLRDIGFDIANIQRGKTCYYHLMSREFELAELKLLVDTIQVSKFITEKKSRDLIKKLESLASTHEAKQLNKQVFVTGRVKASNEKIYYNVDAIHTAIEENKQISFQYWKWNTQKQMELRKDGAFYRISPWALTWDDENYYLIGYDSEEDKIKHFRVDKMKQIATVEDSREGKELFDEISMVDYVKQNFGMFGGMEQDVKMEFNNDIVGVVLDRFGKDIMLVPSDETHFHVTLKVAVSDQFLGWVFALGSDAKILGPEDVCVKMKDMAQKIVERY